MLEKFRFVIIGAGPSGLAFAHALLSIGENSFVVLERETSAGGLCRSEEIDGAPLDTGGGHFLETRPGEVLDLLFRFMPREEWHEFERDSRIILRGREISYPLEANLWQLPVEEQADFLESIARAGSVLGEPMPESFSAWICWKLGSLIADEYMLPYNRKIWSIDLDRLGTYWLNKLPSVSFRETLLSCLECRPRGSLPAHGTFFYPKAGGIGELWKRMGDALGDRLRTGTEVTKIDPCHRLVNSSIRGDTIISTIPWSIWPKLAVLPESIRSRMATLEHTAVDVTYVPETLGTDAQWLYLSDERLPHHRILCRSNFIPGSRGHWTETNAMRTAGVSAASFRNEFAYPLNTIAKPGAIAEILSWGREHGIIGLGRWGKWEHMNMDVAVSQAMAAARELAAAGVPS